MKRIPFDRFSDKRFYYANAPPCKQGFSLTTDFTWRILLCTKKFLIRFNLLRINGISRIPRFMHTVPVLLIFEPHSQGYRCINNWRCWYIPNWKETFRDFTRNIQSLPFRNPLLLQKILKKNWDDDDIPRMKRDRKLPTVLTKTEISAILDATPNLKHKAMIATMYSGGLRVSEVTHLHYDDISRTKKPYTSVMGKVALIVILCLQTGRSKYWQNTGFNVADQEGFCSQVHGQGIILQKIVSFSFFVKVPKEQAFRNTSPRIVYVTALQVICLNPAVM